jgi:streptogramin lyase
MLERLHDECICFCACRKLMASTVPLGPNPLVVVRLRKPALDKIFSGVTKMVGYKPARIPIPNVRSSVPRVKFISESANHRIRSISQNTMEIKTLIGNGSAGCSPSGTPRSQVALRGPTAMVFDGMGNLYFADTGCHRIGRVDRLTGTFAVLAGTGHIAQPGTLCMPATDPRTVPLSHPSDLALLPDGSLLIADTGSNCVRVLDAKTGKMTTLAGTGKEASNDEGSPVDGVGCREANVACMCVVSPGGPVMLHKPL